MEGHFILVKTQGFAKVPWGQEDDFLKMKEYKKYASHTSLGIDENICIPMDTGWHLKIIYIFIIIKKAKFWYLSDRLADRSGLVSIPLSAHCCGGAALRPAKPVYHGELMLVLSPKDKY